MNLAVVRTIGDLRPVLKDQTVNGQEAVYWVFNQINNGQFCNLTVIGPGLIGEEFPKTFGHYHGVKMPEIYQVVAGNGILVLQKPGTHYEEITEVFLVKAKAGDRVVIDPEYGHSWSNVGEGPLILFDDWQFGHTPSDYEPIRKLAGMAYFLTNQNGQVIPVPNRHYLVLPSPRCLEADNFRK